MADLFISYSRRDRGFVAALKDALEARGKDVWVDLEDIPPTAEWLDEIRAGIDAADDFVFVISPDSVASQVAGTELDHAVVQGKRIVPLLHREPNGVPVPHALAARNWIFFREEDPFATSLDTLAEALETDLDWVRAHTRLLTRATEWDAKQRDRSLLLRGADLAQAEAWLARHRPDRGPSPTPLQSQYLVAGRSAATRRQRVTVGATAVALAVSLALAAFAFVQRGEAVKQSRTAEAGALAANADAQVGIDPQLSLLLARRAVDLRPTAAAESALRAAVAASKVRTIFRGPRDFVTWAAFSPDGTTVAASSRDHTARLWRVGEPDAYAVLRGHTDWVNGVFWSPDGATVLTISSDRTARLWDAEDGAPRLTYSAHAAAISWGGFSPDGSAVVTCGRDGTARIWSAASGATRTAPLRSGDGRVAACAWSPDGSRVATGSDGGTIGVWDATDGHLVARADQGSPVIDVAWSPDGTRLASASTEGAGALWDARSAHRVARLDHSGSAALAIAFSHDGTLLASGGYDGSIHLWDASTGAPRGDLIGHANEIYSVAFSPDDSLVVSASADESARIWSRRGIELERLLGHQGFVRSASFDAEGRAVLTAGDDATARIWDARESVSTVEIHDGHPLAAAFFDGGDESVTTVGPTTVARWSAGDGTKEGEVSTRVRVAAVTADLRRALIVDGDRVGVSAASSTIVWLDGEAGISSAAFTADGRRVATGHADGTAQIWDTASGHLLATARGHSATVNDVAFSADGTLLATASSDQTGRVWEAATGRVRAVLRGHSSPVYSIAFAPAGDRVATAGGDGSARIWNAASGRLLVRLLGHATVGGVALTRPVRDAQFDPSGRILATAGWDGTARVWDASSGRELLTLARTARPSDLTLGQLGPAALSLVDPETPEQVAALEPGDFVTSVAFDARSRHVVAASSDGDARIYACAVCGSLADLRAEAARRTVRELTPAEQVRYLGDRAP